MSRPSSHDLAGSAQPESGPGCLLYVGGPACLVLGTLWLLIGVLGYLGPLVGSSLPISEPAAYGLSTAGTIALAGGWWMTRRAARRSKRVKPSGEPLVGPTDLTFHGVALAGGKSATARLERQTLTLEISEPRTWVIALGAIAVAFHIAYVVGGTFAGVPGPRIPFHIWIVAGLIGMQRRVVRRYPLDAFGAVEVREKTVRLHRRGAHRPPLDIAVKSWNVHGLADALRARAPDAFRAAPPPEAPIVRDEAAELREELASWLPAGQGAVVTWLGAGLLIAALLLGGFHRLDGLPLARYLSWGTGFAALLVWLQGRGMRSLREQEARRLAASAPERLVVETKRNRGDLLGMLAPWQRTEVETQSGLLVLVHTPHDPFEITVVAGVACASSYLILGSFAPWWAAACYVALLASGYPRRRTDPVEILATHITALEDAGSRGTLQLDDETGARVIELRFSRGGAARFAGIVRELAPQATIREPSWRRHPDAVINRLD